MTGKTTNKSVLTDKGILALYKQESRDTAVNVQVIFLASCEDKYFLRLSDGKFMSPVVYLDTKKHNPLLVVGAIISITEVKLMPFETSATENIFQDMGLHDLYIHKYSVLETRESVGKVVGLVGTRQTYRQAINYIHPTQKEFNHGLLSEMRWDQYKSKDLQSERDQMRERGNIFFREKSYDQAIIYYEIAIKRDPFDVRVWNNCSLAFYNRTEYVFAEKFALVAIKMDPFNEKAYHRAIFAALGQKKNYVASAYYYNGTFMCGKINIADEILDQITLPHNIQSSILVELTRDILFNFGNAHIETRVHHNIKQEPKRLIMEDNILSFPKKNKEKKINTGKLIKTVQEENKKKEEERRKREEEEERRRAQEEGKKRQVQEARRDVGIAKLRESLNDNLVEGRRLFESNLVHQAMEMFAKCLSLYSHEVNGHVNKNTGGERPEVMVLQFILGMCKVKGGRGSIMDGIEIMNSLCDDTCKFIHKPAAHCLLAKAFFDINLYNLGLQHADICCEMLKRSKYSKVVKWPGGSGDPITETKPEILQEMCLELKNRPISSRPAPEAICRFMDCLTTQGHPYAKDKIYKSDPDFRGYVAVLCEESCVVCYHPGCWKAYKELQEVRRPDKDFIGLGCMTPDCTGTISSIRIFDECGELKNEQAKDKKDKNLQPTKVKKKKDKKKEKNMSMKGNDKNKTRTESVNEEVPVCEEAELTTEAVTQNNAIAQEKPKPYPANAAAVPLPIDPDSLDLTQVTVIKPVTATENDATGKQLKKSRKKKKKAKTTTHLDLFTDPLATSDETIQNEYVARLHALKRQKDALEGNMALSSQMTTPGAPSSLSMLELDLNNPFYLPQHLQDNPEELECMLQMKVQDSSTGLKRETIDTLFQFMCDWLKAEGPMSIHDDRLRDQVSEYFPPEAQTYVTQCGGIRNFLKQSLKFAMLDDIICASSDVVKAQEMMCDDIKMKMKTSKYLTKFSDQHKAKKFSHLLDDRSIGSSASSVSQVAGSALSSASKNTFASTQSSVPSISRRASASTSSSIIQTSSSPVLPISAPSSEPFVLNTLSSDVTASSLPITSSAAEPLTMLDPECVMTVEPEEYTDPSMQSCEWMDSIYSTPLCTSLNPTAKPFEPCSPSDETVLENDLPADENDEDEEIDEEEEVENEEDLNSDDELFQSDEEEESVIDVLRVENSDLKEKLSCLEEEKQSLYDKLYQTRSQSKSEIGRLKQQLEEATQELKNTSLEKQSLAILRESDTRKLKNDLGRLQDEIRTLQSRNNSLQMKFELANDRINELTGKLADEEEANAELKAETTNLQESLTSSNRRAHEAEVKYLCIKKDLVEENLNRTIERLTTEVNCMKEMLPSASNNSKPDGETLVCTIVAWEETIQTLLDHKKAFMEEGMKLLGMINQGRPLSALPPGDLQVPGLPVLSLVELLRLMQNPDSQSADIQIDQDQQSKEPTTGASALPSTDPWEVPTTDVKKSQLTGVPVMYQTPQPPVMANSVFMGPPGIPPVFCVLPPPGLVTPAAPPGNDTTMPPPSEPPLLPMPTPPLDAVTDTPLPGMASGATCGVTTTAPSLVSAPVSAGAVPKSTPSIQQAKFQDTRSATQSPDTTNQLFVGKLPWTYDESDLKPIVINNHALNVQPKESRKNKASASSGVGVEGVVVGGGKGVGGGSEVAVSAGHVFSSAYGLSDIALDSEMSNLSANAQHPTSLPLGPNSATPSTAAAMTKPNFKNLTSTDNVGGIRAAPPKLIRPQPKHTQLPAKPTTASGAKEDSVTSAPSYKRLIDMCKQRLGKDFTSPEICAALREVRASNNNSLSGMNLDKIVERVRRTIRGRRPGVGPATVAPWAGMAQGGGGDGGPEWLGPKKESGTKEETCSICLDVLTAFPTVPLNCKHLFHRHCIEGWFKHQKNCPNCRTFALMNDEYPKLPQA